MVCDLRDSTVIMIIKCFIKRLSTYPNFSGSFSPILNFLGASVDPPLQYNLIKGDS